MNAGLTGHASTIPAMLASQYHQSTLPAGFEFIALVLGVSGTLHDAQANQPAIETEGDMTGIRVESDVWFKLDG
jgi:hypothetical protein